MENKVASNLFAIAGTIIWSVQLIPQIKLNYKLQSTKGLSVLCFLSWYITGIILGTYLIFSHQAPMLIVQILSFTIFCGIICLQYLYYERKMVMEKIGLILVGVVLGTLIGCFGIYDLMAHYRQKEFTLSLICTILASGFMVLGFLPQIHQIYQSKSVEGLSKIFVVMDLMGGVFSILSLLFHVPFDFLAFSTYLVVPIFQTVIFTMIMYYNKYYPKLKNTTINIDVEDIETTSKNNNEILMSTPKSSPKSFVNQIDHEMITMLSQQPEIFTKKPSSSSSSSPTFLTLKDQQKLDKKVEKEQEKLSLINGDNTDHNSIPISINISDPNVLDIQIINPDNQLTPIDELEEVSITRLNDDSDGETGAILN